MRRTQILLQQHLGWIFRKHWKIQGQRVLQEHGSLKEVKERGIQVVNAVDIIQPKVEREKLNFEDIFGPTEKDFSAEQIPCLVYRDNNVLLEGLIQALALTNTVQIDDSLPESSTQLDKIRLSYDDIDILTQRFIKSSLLHESEQKLLPKIKDPERPAWVFPRNYGITNARRNYLLTNRLISMCEIVSPELCSEYRLTQNAKFTTPIEWDGKKILLDLQADLLILSKTGVKPIVSSDVTLNSEIPNIEPLLPTVSIEEQLVPNTQHDYFPIPKGVTPDNIHLAIVYFDDTEVTNIYETPVTESQILGRTLMKAFTFAVSQARHTYGSDISRTTKDLKEPIVIRCIHTNGQWFNFSVFQLNTLQTSSQVHNIFWSSPLINLFDECSYDNAKPTLSGYNASVIKLLLAFYRNS